MINAILTNNVLPAISEELLKRMLGLRGEFSYGFE
jgi:hypothetical protein